MTKTAAIYTRVSSDRQKESGTIASQTAALQAFAQEREYIVPPEWVFEDDGFSGARLDRPGLEAVRDLAAEGRIEAVLVLSPDRLSRKYAYQVLLLEEFARCGVACEFVESPAAETPQERLLVQVQGMIAEYERALIAERSRRGKRHKARNGSPSVLSGAPYGYRYVKRSEGIEARYEILAGEAEVVRQVFDNYTREQCSIGAIARRLTEQGIRTRTGKTRWERSVIWAILRNPAYRGRACYGKTGTGPRQRVTRPLRGPGQFASQQVSGLERPREEWIEIPVPALVSAEQFEQAQEQLEANKRHATRRTKEPTLLQGMLACRRCGYAYYRCSTRTTKRKLYYYRCLGSDGWRYEDGVRCPSRPVRQDRLDAVVWRELVRLLEEPALIQAELERRLEAGREADPQRRRLMELRGERERLERAGARLVTAYQEELIGLDELRSRMPAMRSRKRVLEAELEAIESAAEERERYLRIAETLESFRERLRTSAEALDVIERQKLLRSLVKEVLVGDGEITIRHSIPMTGGNGSSHGKPASNAPRQDPGPQGYLLRSGSNRRVCVRGVTVEPLGNGPIVEHPIEIRVMGDDEKQLFAIVDAIKVRLGEDPSVLDIGDNWGSRIKKLIVDVDSVRARRANLSNEDIATSLASALSGLAVTEYREGSEVIPVAICSSETDRNRIARLETLNVHSQSTGQSVPLQAVADLEVDWQPAMVFRRNRLKAVTVYSGLARGATAAEVTGRIGPWLAEQSSTWPLGFRYELGGEIEASSVGTQSIVDKLPVAGLAIILLLVGQFNSIRRPLIILLTIPLGLIGVIFGLLITGSYMGFMTFLGVISLAGIVINNAIVLLDRIRIEIEDLGRRPDQAILEAARRRLRPILLTTVTTSGGLIPLWLGGGVMFEPMAIAILFGLLFATALTLGVVPVLYAILFRVPYGRF